MTCINGKATFKRGKTLSWPCLYAPSGTPVNLTGATIASQLRTADGTLIANLTATLADQTASTGAFTLSYASSTADFPLGEAYFDVRITLSGVIDYSDTGVINIVDRVTV